MGLQYRHDYPSNETYRFVPRCVGQFPALRLRFCKHSVPMSSKAQDFGSGGEMEQESIR
jgi:hypothetical protein